MTELTPAELAYERQQALYAHRGIAVDAFGVPVAEQDAGSGPVRQIVITEDLAREDMEKREASEVRKEGITWRRPEPLPEEAYRKVAKPARGRVAPAKKPRLAKAPKPAATTQPAPPLHQEEPPMETQPAPLTCIVQGCTKSLTPRNTSGRCSAHWYLAKGTAFKDGSVWPGMPGTKAAKPGKPAKAAKPAKATPLKKGVSAAPPPVTGTALEVKVAVPADMVMLPVPIAALDSFLVRLSVGDKVRLVAAEIAKGAYNA